MAVIVVPTDFSPTSDNAARYAAQLAMQTNGEVHLLHFFSLPMGYADMQPPLMDGTFMQTPAYLIPIEDLKEAAETNMARSRDSFAAAHPGVAVKTVVRIGSSIAADINDYCDEVLPLLVVMASHPMQGIDTIVGSTTLSLAKHLHHPLLAVPEGYTQPGFSRMVLATDLTPVSPQSTTIIHNLATTLGSRLEMVHVTTEKEISTTLPEALQSSFATLQPSYTTLTNEDVTEALKEYLADSHNAVLVVLPHHHNLWEKLFFKLHTADLITHLPVPVLCIPE